MSTFLNISDMQKVVPSPTAQHYVVILEGDVPHCTSVKNNFLVLDGTIPSTYSAYGIATSVKLNRARLCEVPWPQRFKTLTLPYIIRLCNSCKVA